MIEIRKITDEISQLRYRIDNEGIAIKKTQRTKIINRITFLTTTIAYLEQDNREEFLNSELDRLNKRVSLINKDYINWIPSKYYEKENHKLKDYIKEMGVPKLKAQIKALRFILNK